MAMSLDQWQERLESHFAQLVSARSSSDFPLFALEHGLMEDEFEEITGLLHAQLADGWRLGRHWLVWVAYAQQRLACRKIQTGFLQLIAVAHQAFLLEQRFNVLDEQTLARFLRPPHPLRRSAPIKQNKIEYPLRTPRGCRIKR